MIYRSITPPLGSVSRYERQRDEFIRKHGNSVSVDDLKIVSGYAFDQSVLSSVISQIRSAWDNQSLPLLDDKDLKYIAKLYLALNKIRVSDKRQLPDFAMSISNFTGGYKSQRDVYDMINGRYMPVYELTPDIILSLQSLVPDLTLLDQVLEKGAKYQVFAHGVSVKNGGLLTLLNIMLEGRVGDGFDYASCGVLRWGLAAESAGPHGPYYVLLPKDVLTRQMEKTSSKIFPEDTHVLYLVPSNMERMLLLASLESAKSEGLIFSSEFASLSKKICTFSDFLVNIDK